MTMARALLWPVPELDDRPPPAAGPPGATPADPEAEVEAVPAEAPDSASSWHRRVQQEIAAGYAEGLERGLAEGRERGLAEGRESGFAIGRESGYAAGLASGSEAAQAELERQAQRLRDLIARLGAPIPALDAVVEEAVVALALEAARCVIGCEVSISRGYLAALIRKAVAKIPIEMGTPQLVLNPADLETVGLLLTDLEGEVVLAADETLEPGDCRVVCDRDGANLKDRRWRSRSAIGAAQVDLSLAARWRAAMLAMFEGEDQ